MQIADKLALALPEQKALASALRAQTTVYTPVLG
jgi:hypothetical protein